MQEEPVKHVRKGMAIASLVLGIVSIPTCGLLGIGSIVGIILGVAALNRISRNPAEYGGKGMALGGIITSIVGLFLIAIYAAIAIPQLNSMLKGGRDTAAIEMLNSIHLAEASFYATNHRYGTFQELAGADLFNRGVVNRGVFGGYIYTEAEVSEQAFCIQATRASDSVGYRDFNITEAGVVNYVEARQPAAVARGQGTPITEPASSK